jgi:phosphoglycerate dehydrogenase-like enzyme
MRYVSTLNFDDGWLDALREAAPGIEVLQLPAEKPADLPEAIWPTIDVLHTSYLLPDPEVATSLKLVQLDTSGCDHVRDTALWRSDVDICTIGGVSPVPLAEFVMFAILGYAHRLPQVLEVSRTRTWPTPEERWRRFLPTSLEGATVGIVGYGRIGREIGRMAASHGMTVVGVNRTGRLPDPEEQGMQADFGRTGRGATDAAVELFPATCLREQVGRVDYLVVVCPLTHETRGMVSADVIAAMKPGSVLINVARGGIVDEIALLAALRTGTVAGAVLDVFDSEPLPADSPWWQQPNVLVTPHVGGLAPRYAEQVLQIVTENLRRLTAGEPLLNRVDRARGY